MPSFATAGVDCEQLFPPHSIDVIGSPDLNVHFWLPSGFTANKVQVWSAKYIIPSDPMTGEASIPALALNRHFTVLSTFYVSYFDCPVSL